MYSVRGFGLSGPGVAGVFWVRDDGARSCRFTGLDLSSVVQGPVRLGASAALGAWFAV